MKHVKLVTSAFVLASLFSSVTFANASYKGEVMPLMPAYYNWTGFYAGVNVGGVDYTSYVTDIDQFDYDSTLRLDPNASWTGGLQIGWRYQVNNAPAAGVFGVEGSFNWVNHTYSTTFGGGGAVPDYDISTKLKNIWMIQAMGGIAADRTLLFLGAGVAWVDVSGSWVSLDGNSKRDFSTSKNQVGGVLSAGVEYAFTDMISLRLKVDDVVTKRYSNSNDDGFTFLTSNNVVQATLGLNVKFA